MAEKIQAIILAAGKSTRTHPLTLTKPKPMLKVANKTLLEHNLDQLKGLVDEAIIVVGYKKEMIEEYLGAEYNGIHLIYVHQKEQLGTGHAVMQTESKIRNKFILMPGDDLFSHEDIRRCSLHDYCVLATEVDTPERFGIFTVSHGNVIGIEEKPEKPKSNLANTALWVMDKRLISLMKEQPKSKRGEYEITDALNALLKEQKVVCEIVKDFWLPVGYPWDLIKANNVLVGRQKKKIRGKLEKNVTVKGDIVVGEGTQILNGVYIEGNINIGKNCKIGPNCYLRGNTSIGDNCHIGASVEIKNCVIGNKTNVPHLNYVGDSVIGDNCNIAAGCIVANLRHDKKNILSPVKGKMVDTGRYKFGAIIGDNVKLGIKTIVYPGRKIWPNCTTDPGEIVKKDIEK